jgi:hypothetical protein
MRRGGNQILSAAAGALTVGAGLIFVLLLHQLITEACSIAFLLHRYCLMVDRVGIINQ